MVNIVDPALVYDLDSGGYFGFPNYLITEIILGYGQIARSEFFCDKCMDLTRPYLVM